MAHANGLARLTYLRGDGTAGVLDVHDVDALHDEEGAVGSSNLAEGAVTNGKIAAGAVTSAELATGSVIEAVIEDGVVTRLKLAQDAVGTPNIANGAVTGEKLTQALRESIAQGPPALTAANSAKATADAAKATASAAANKLTKVRAVICGTKIIEGNGTAALPFMGEAEFKGVAGRAYSAAKGDVICVINADSDASGVLPLGLIYVTSSKILQLHLSSALGAGISMRINYILCLGA